MKFPDFQEIKSDLEFIDDWQDRYAYLIEIGKQLPNIGNELKKDNHLVPGCVSRVWLHIEDDPYILKFRVFSEALIVNGLLYIVCSIYQGRQFAEVNKIDTELIFRELGLQEHLTPGRVNGLRSVIFLLKDYIESKAGFTD